MYTVTATYHSTFQKGCLAFPAMCLAMVLYCKLQDLHFHILVHLWNALICKVVKYQMIDIIIFPSLNGFINFIFTHSMKAEKALLCVFLPGNHTLEYNRDNSTPLRFD